MLLAVTTAVPGRTVPLWFRDPASAQRDRGDPHYYYDWRVYFLRGVAAILFDKNFHSYPGFAGTTPLQIGGASVLPQSLIVLAGVGAIVFALWLLMSKTLVGKAIVATAANKAAAQLVGVNTGWIIALSFAASAAIGAVGGILATPITLTNYDVGTLLALKGFAAAMLGGMGNPIGAVAGGLIVGLLESFGAGYLSSAYKDAIAFIVILAVLFVMPQGLFGRASVERV
jgi:branched-chain amino acid transport system permease protein